MSSAQQLIFSHTKGRRIFLLKCFGVSQYAVWGYMGYSMYDLYEKKKHAPKALTVDNSFKARFAKVVGESKFTKFASYFCVVMGFAMASAATFVSARTVRSMQLVGRNRVLFETYGVLVPKTTKINVADVQTVPRRTRQAYILLRLNGKPLYYFIDRDGNFPMPNLFTRVTAASHSI